MEKILERSLKEIFKYTAKSENNIGNANIEKLSQINSDNFKDPYMKRWYGGEDVRRAQLSSITFVPSKSKSSYWEGKRFKLVFETLGTEGSTVLGWGWAPNGDSDIFDDFKLTNSRIDCLKSGLMRRVYYDNYTYNKEGIKCCPYLVWVNGRFNGIEILPEEEDLI